MFAADWRSPEKEPYRQSVIPPSPNKKEKKKIEYWNTGSSAHRARLEPESKWVNRRPAKRKPINPRPREKPCLSLHLSLSPLPPRSPPLVSSLSCPLIGLWALLPWQLSLEMWGLVVDFWGGFSIMGSSNQLLHYPFLLVIIQLLLLLLLRKLLRKSRHLPRR